LVFPCVSVRFQFRFVVYFGSFSVSVCFQCQFADAPVSGNPRILHSAILVNGRFCSITANLGDTKSTITHPGTTTHGRIGAEARAAAGIGEGLVRVAVGLESVEDLKIDLARGLG
jgi:hypothetical protein